LLLGPILDSGAVYYPLLFGIPVAAGIVVAWKNVPRRGALWILAAVCAAEMLVDFALDEERWSDLPFFVVVGLVLFGLAAFFRWLVLRLRRPGRAGE
jgi:phosphoglycerol transferase MdoB-like AlkP superfamily enzyme